jgi:type I restriction enzyme R subunit
VSRPEYTHVEAPFIDPRYRDALRLARDEMVTEIESLDPMLVSIGEKARSKLNPRTQLLLRAHPRLDLIRALDAAPVISIGNNDDPAWAEWSDGSKVKDHIVRFKRRLGSADTEYESPLAFLIVKSMLLTGFDAPVEQAIYLDRAIKEAELLQAIARVNRSGPDKKRVGIVVDYYGVARHLHAALQAYDAADIEGALRSIKDELPNLRDAHLRAVAIFRDRGLSDLSDVEACVQLLRDERLRAEFVVKLRELLGHLDTVLPRPEALPFVDDAGRLTEIHARARRRYRDPGPILDPEDGAKVAALIDRYLVSRGIDPRIPPIEILDARFPEHVRDLGSDRARASEMEHAIRHHIRKHLDEDPVHYQALSERLDEILREFEGRWDELVQEIGVIINEAQEGRQQDDTGLDPQTQAPFLAVLRQEIAGGADLSREALNKLCELTVEIVDHIRQEIRIVNFWKNVHAQEVLRSEVFEQLDRADVLPFDRLDAVADRLIELAKAKHNQLVG